ncbi:sugar-specific transcriptional regulator TrmB [Herbihabitans rhizosphaerae]|uniref:Sugar-specific transcriptional regulator TrmB n=1 Tax=Herbihabitans rhizosphaerae TaxID=1872711 RepID=A0A4Q7L639_9PSEU|nr:hypothetical protein [Herbihabitans rhizosphaerae]RZS44310.1 sugar-specific transcriptional regulator TrmB [Herbihabitans rhizosphaerae]
MALTDLGFTKQQELAYRALVDDPTMSLADVAGLIGCGRNTAREILDGLVELGVAKVARDGDLGVALAHPVSALGDLIERREDELLRMHRRVGDTRAEVAELGMRFAGRAGLVADPDSGIERVTDLEVLRERLEELAFFTRSTVYAVQPGGALSEEMLNASRPLDLRALRRGVDMRIIYNTTFLADQYCRDYLRDIVAAGAAVRITDDSLDRMIIMDKRVVVVPIDPDRSHLGGQIVRQPGLVMGFMRLFDQLWDAARPLPWADEEDERAFVPTDEDRQVLALLASGSTDETAARAAGISVRHLRRRVAKLMERLDAGSRFEAGVEATRRGWI